MPDHLLERSVPFQADFFEKQAELLERLAQEGQSPEALLIACSDSRVFLEPLLGASPGDLFVLRNIANIIPPYEENDMAITAVLEYAVRHLQVPHLIICGHTDCGGIKGLETQLDAVAEPALTHWIEYARPAQQAVDSGPKLDEWDRHRAIVERNVVQQLRHLQTYPFVLEALESNGLELHGWIYYLKRRLMGYYDPVKDQFDILGAP
jgi:carbonic anhydrase